ncbi:MAG: UvrD-helicase domain-containing protein [Clostridia bacterium]|nr:UvrD-helicase domain-containing protein [Clostridia bacterium]
MAKATVAISQDFFNSFAALPKNKQNKVMEFLSKFRSNPEAKGFNYEKIQKASDPNMRSVRIDDTYRAILIREEGTNVYLLLWVDHHDEAYAWAARKRCVLNHATGSIQVYETQEAAAEPEVPAASEEKPLFADLSDELLRKLGVPEELLTYVRSLTEAGFDAAKDRLPRDAYEALDYVRVGLDPKEVIEELYGESTGEKTGDLVTALQNPITKMQFYVAEGEEDLKAMMNAPLEKWRVYLHPSQLRIVRKEYKGPARILGGAGTGKTVVAMHRAKELASHCLGNERILFTTFTENLAADIQENLRKICTPDVMKHIEVIHLDQWVNRYLRAHDYPYTIVYGDPIREMWKNAESYTGEDFDLPEGFFQEEWETVVQAQNIQTVAEYVKTPRPGRGVRLDRKQRMRVWKVFDEYRTLMDAEKVRDSACAMNECAQLLTAGPGVRLYSSVIVDEGQDFGPSAYRLLRAIAGSEHTNDLFIVGDAHQRIYKNKVTLSRCGINVKGRSGRLRMNYRTTEEIRHSAMNVLAGLSFDDLDDGIDDGKGYISLSHGDRPVVNVYSTQDQEAAELIRNIQEQMAAGIDPREICIVARTSPLLGEYKKFLSAADIDCFEIKRRQADDRSRMGVRLATMHRVKGLEFSTVFIVAANKNVIPLKSAVNRTDPTEKEAAMASERCLLYVAMTRAKKKVMISAYGAVSGFLG